MSVEENLRLLGMAPARNRNVLHIDNGDKPGYTYCGLRKARRLRDYADQEKSVWCKRCLRAISAVPKPAYLVRKHPAIRRMAHRSLGLQERFSSIALARPPRTRRYGLRRPIVARIVDGYPVDAGGRVLGPDYKPDPNFRHLCPPNTEYIVDVDGGIFLDADRRRLTRDGERDGHYPKPYPPGAVEFADGHPLDREGYVLTKSGRRDRRFAGPYQPRNENWSIRREFNSGMGWHRSGRP